jgi:hypothetical protein
MTTVRLPLLLAVILLPLVLAGCDAAGGDTATFSENSEIPPTVEYEFEYDAGNQVQGQNLVEVTSGGADNLDEVLRVNGGFSRSSIVSASVDSVVFIQVSPPEDDERSNSKFIFTDLAGAEVFLGNDDSGVRIAQGEFEPTDRRDRVPLDVVTNNVTETIKTGSTKAFLRLETSESLSQKDIVAVKVFYKITVSGV